MDVAPEWYEDWSRTHCVGKELRCGGGDEACAEAARQAGYAVRIGNYGFCRPADVRHEPGTMGYASIAVVLGIAFAAGMLFSRYSRTRRNARAG
jgi:hypothetical protein